MSYKLTYLPLRARAEPIRMLFHYAGISFTDEVILLSDWPVKKFDSRIAPFAQLPSLTLPSGIVLAQSAAIMRYIAKIANLYPEDAIQAAKADMLCDLVRDLEEIEPLLNWYSVNEDSFTSHLENFYNRLAEVAQYLNDELGKNSFFGGCNPHLGDFGLFHIFSLAIAIRPAVLDPYPNLTSFVRHFAAIPAIKQYLNTRPRAEENGLEGSYIKVYKTEFIFPR